jgi:hypothetical protein
VNTGEDSTQGVLLPPNLGADSIRPAHCSQVGKIGLEKIGSWQPHRYPENLEYVRLSGSVLGFQEKVLERLQVIFSPLESGPALQLK